jgi:penicillin amidase
MKRVIGSIFLVTGTGIWLFFTSFHFEGLNSIQHLANFHEGLLSKVSLPKVTGTVIKSPAGEARVAIDTLGIPHVFARDANAAAFALGFMHARDRYFQMEIIAWSVMGRLSELIGDPGIESDKHWVKFGLEEKAKQFYDSLSKTQPDLYHYLAAYEQGVNTYLNQEERKYRDPLFSVCDFPPSPWKAHYAFLIQWYISHELTFNDDYLDKEELLDKLPGQVRSILYPDRPLRPACIIPAGSSPERSLPAVTGRSVIDASLIQQEDMATSQPANRSLGSNNWVVGASHTTSGQLFLCNDLHLSLATPNIFYETQLYCPEFHTYGYSIPGVPLILTGHNERIAWGITSGGWDVTEQYLLKLDPKNKNNYWLDGKWTPMIQKSITIRVKDRQPEKVLVRYTVFGPCVKKGTLAYGLTWHPQLSASAIPSFWKLARATDWESFREALRLYDYPSQNFVYCDIKGNIGMVCAGKMPVKPPDYAGGLLDGTVSHHWHYIPFDSLPQTLNPSRNYLFSANQMPESGNYYYSSRWYDDLYRPSRIDELLSDGRKLDREDMRNMQLDVTDLSVTDLKKVIAKYSDGKDLAGNWALLTKWDGKLAADTRESAFYRFFRRGARIVCADMAKRINVRSAPDFDQFMNFLLNYDSVTCGENVLRGKDYFEKVVTTTDSLYSKYYAHNASGDRKDINKVYSFVIPQMTHLPGMDVTVSDLGGSDNTINVNYGAHPVIRTLVEIKDGTIRSWMVNAIGQTGRINDKNYLQQLSSWKTNQLHETQFTSGIGKLQYVTGTIVFKHN